MLGVTTSVGATVIGVVNAGAAVPPSFVSFTSTMTVTGTAPGFTTTTDVDELGHFTLSGIPVGDLQLQFSVSGVTASLLIPGVGPGDTIELAVTVDGTTATIETLHRTVSGGVVELDGRISELDVVARTLQVAGVVVFVPDAALIVETGQTLSLDGLSLGDTVEVSGTSDGIVIVADRVNRVAQATQSSVTVAGPVTNLAGRCPTLVFTVGTTAVSTGGATFFDDVPCGDVQNFLSVEVTGLLVAGVVEALSVDVDTVVLEGLVSMVTGTCPSVAFMVDGTLVSADGATRFRDGRCADIDDGVRVQITGVMEVGGIRALDVLVQDPLVSVRGTILGLTGTCPLLSFAINGTPVMTSPTTAFSGGVCADLTEGMPVEGEGQLLAGTLRAETITVDADKTGQTESSSIEGILDWVAGVPPDLVLLVDSVSVVTSASTRVTRRGDTQTLASLVAGQRVHVVGDRSPLGTIDARTIQIKDDAEGGLAGLEGKVSGLHGDCPAVIFVINGVHVATNVLTTFDGSVCAWLRNGQRVAVSGLAQADGTVVATSVDAEPSKENENDQGKDGEKNGKGKGKGQDNDGNDENGNGEGKGQGKGTSTEEDEGADNDDEDADDSDEDKNEDEDDEEEDSDEGENGESKGNGKGKGKGKKKSA